MPQGGIDKGETPAKAALRELKEEIGTNKADPLAEMDEWLCYDLPKHLLGAALHGRFRGQRQKWLAMRFTGNDGDIDVKTHEPEFAALEMAADRCRWPSYRAVQARYLCQGDLGLPPIRQASALKH